MLFNQKFKLTVTSPAYSCIVLLYCPFTQNRSRWLLSAEKSTKTQTETNSDSLVNVMGHLEAIETDPLQKQDREGTLDSSISGVLKNDSK